MKTKSITIPLRRSRAVTLSLWKDLSLVKINRMNVLIGCEVSRNIRLNALERLDTTLVAFGPFGVTYSKGYLREEGV